MLLQMGDISTTDRQYYLQHIIAPRPICFASTIDKEGRVNLSPFSFFNLFSSNPPIVIFSPSRRVRDNTTKHTLQNVYQVPEVVINMVSHHMVQQTSLASCDYPRGIDEFTKAGFTKEKASRVQPPMVKESLAKMECRVVEIKTLGKEAGAGNLIICEILCLHLDEKILDANGKPDPHKLDQVARLGGDWYCRVTPENLFKVEKPNSRLGMGFDALPQSILQSRILTGNHLGQLANVEELPVIDAAFNDEHLKNIVQYYAINPDEMEKETHSYAAKLLDEGRVQEAWQVLLATSSMES